MNNQLSRFSGLIKQDAAAAKAAQADLDAMFGSAAPDRYAASHLTMCLDGSGSIYDLVDETKAAYKQLANEFPNISRIDLMFYDRITRLDNINQFRADGNTALRDSIIAGIEVTEAEIGHDNIMFVITSDGMDNASRASVEEVRAAVEAKKAKGWQFFAIYLTKNAQLNWRGSSACAAFDALGLESIQEQDVTTAIKKLSDAIYGYLETGRLLLPETT